MNKGSFKISLIIVTIIIIATATFVTTYSIYGRIKESKSDFSISSKLVNASIPKNVKVLQSSDSHGALGDGEYFVVFQFTEIQYIEFLKKLSHNTSWIDLPMQYDLNKFIFGEKKGLERYGGHGENKIPKITRHGKYFFRDKFIVSPHG